MLVSNLKVIGFAAHGVTDKLQQHVFALHYVSFGTFQ